MKKGLVIATFMLLLASLVLLAAQANIDMGASNENAPVLYAQLNETGGDTPLVGESCGTVTPGTENECCINKGFSGWDAEKFDCVNQEDEEDLEAGYVCKDAAAGTKTQCCTQEGYSGWDQKKGKCIGERREITREKPDCEAWTCTEWSTCQKWEKTRRCSRNLSCTVGDLEKPKVVKDCEVKEKINFYNKSADCPEACKCSGSTVKCSLDDGTRVMTVYAGNSGNMIVQVKDINMSTNVVLYKGGDGKVYAVLKDNETKEIILPDKAKERLQEHFKARLYNESVNLTEDGYYQIKTKKKARLFLIVPVREHLEAQVNAETGEVVRIRNPWWGFLAKDTVEETPAENTSEVQTE